jgi:hypothetical protein
MLSAVPPNGQRHPKSCKRKKAIGSNLKGGQRSSVNAKQKSGIRKEAIGSNPKGGHRSTVHGQRRTKKRHPQRSNR